MRAALLVAAQFLHLVLELGLHLGDDALLLADLHAVRRHLVVVVCNSIFFNFRAVINLDFILTSTCTFSSKLIHTIISTYAGLCRIDERGLMGEDLVKRLKSQTTKSQ